MNDPPASDLGLRASTNPSGVSSRAQVVNKASAAAVTARAARGSSSAGAGSAPAPLAATSAADSPPASSMDVELDSL